MLFHGLTTGMYKTQVTTTQGFTVEFGALDKQEEKKLFPLFLIVTLRSQIQQGLVNHKVLNKNRMFQPTMSSMEGNCFVTGFYYQNKHPK